MFCIRIRYAACAGAASTAPSSSRRAAVTRSSASRARIHWFRAAAMAALRWAAIVGPLTSMTLAPCARAIATVSSVEPPSATMTSSAQRSDASASAICHASLSVGITTVRGSEAGGTEGTGGTGGARSGMTSSGCERSGLRLGCWSRGCPLIIQHAFRRHTVVMTTLLLAHDFPPLGGGIARLHGELARRYPAGELIVSTPQDPDAADVDAQYNGAVDRLPIGRRTTKSLPGLLLWSRRAASLARRHHVRFVHCGNVAPRGEPRPPAPRPLRALRQREARGVPCPLGARAVSRAVQCIPLWCRRAERAAQDPAVGFQAPRGARRVRGRGRARRDQRLDARSRAFGARRPRARRPRPAAPRRAPRYGPRAVPARPGRWRAAAALRPPGRRGALAPHRGAARAAQGRGHGG